MTNLDPRYKTVPCKVYEACGFCSRESTCHFAHGRDELRTVEENVADGAEWPAGKGGKKGPPSGGKIGAGGGGAVGGKKGVTGAHDPSKYKTALCTNFIQSGMCTMGMKCLFAHGPQELRTQGANMYLPDKAIQNYKRAMCKHWETTGMCPRGGSCTFAHGHQELALYNGYGGKGSGMAAMGMEGGLGMMGMWGAGMMGVPGVGGLGAVPMGMWNPTPFGVKTATKTQAPDLHCEDLPRTKRLKLDPGFLSRAPQQPEEELPAEPREDDIFSKLQELMTWRADGSITESEFIKLKAELGLF